MKRVAKRRGARTPRSIYPISLERDYARRLKRRLRLAAKTAKREIEHLAVLRADSEASDERAVERILGSVRLAYFERFTEVEDQELTVEVAGRAEGYIERQVTRQVKTVMGVDPMPTRELRQQAMEFAQENVSLIRSVEEEFFSRLEGDIVLALRQGARWEQLSPVIQERYKVSGRRAELIARDQMGSLVSKVNQAKQQSTGATQYIWRNSQDERVVGNPSGLYPRGNDRHGNHWEREGQKFSWSNPPHDGHPGEAINCRCTAEPVWEEEEDFADNVEVRSVSTGSSSPVISVGAGAGTPDDFYDNLRPSSRIKPQEREYSCGVACVRQVLEDAGINVTEEELREEIGYSFYAENLKGVPLQDIERLMKSRGLNARAGAVTLEDARNLMSDGTGPYIALIENHYVVVDGVSDGIVNIRDPWGPSGPGSEEGVEGEIDAEKFLQAWSRGKLGVVLW